MDLYHGMRPMLDFSSLPQRADERPRRRRRAVKTPKNVRVKSVHAGHHDVQLATKWVSPQFGPNGRQGNAPLDPSSSQSELPQLKRRQNRLKPLDVRKLFPKSNGKENANSRRKNGITSAGQRRQIHKSKSATLCEDVSNRQPLSRLDENTAHTESDVGTLCTGAQPLSSNTHCHTTTTPAPTADRIQLSSLQSEDVGSSQNERPLHRQRFHVPKEPSVVGHDHHRITSPSKASSSNVNRVRFASVIEEVEHSLSQSDPVRDSQILDGGSVSTVSGMDVGDLNDDDSLTQMVTSLSLDVTNIPAGASDKDKLQICITVAKVDHHHRVLSSQNKAGKSSQTACHNQSSLFEVSTFKPPSASTPFRNANMQTAYTPGDDTSYSIPSIAQVKTRDCTFATYHSDTFTRPTTSALQFSIKLENTTCENPETRPGNTTCENPVTRPGELKSNTEQSFQSTSLNTVSPSHQSESSLAHHHCNEASTTLLRDFSPRPPPHPFSLGLLDPGCREGKECVDESVLAKETPSYLWCTPITEQEEVRRTIEDTFG